MVASQPHNETAIFHMGEPLERKRALSAEKAGNRSRNPAAPTFGNEISFITKSRPLSAETNRQARRSGYSSRQKEAEACDVVRVDAGGELERSPGRGGESDGTHTGINNHLPPMRGSKTHHHLRIRPHRGLQL